MSHYISGIASGIPLYLTDPGPIDFSQNYNWTEDFSKRKVFTFDEACGILDEEFYEGEFNGVSGIIIENVVDTDKLS